MRRYELVALIKTESNLEQVVNNIKNLVEENNAHIEDRLFTNNQKLAYPIVGHEFANRYEADIFFEDNKDVKKVNERLCITDGLLRFLLYVGE